MKKINININKKNSDVLTCNISPIYVDFYNQLNIKLLIEKSNNILEKIKDFHNTVTKNDNITVSKVLKYIYTLECLYTEITQNLMILWWNIKILYENNNLSNFEHLEMDRILNIINKFHSYFESSKNCIEIGIDLIIGVQKSNQFTILLTNKFINELILVIMQYYYITKWFNYVLHNNKTLISIFDYDNKQISNDNLSNMFS